MITSSPYPSVRADLARLANVVAVLCVAFPVERLYAETTLSVHNEMAARNDHGLGEEGYRHLAVEAASHLHGRLQMQMRWHDARGLDYPGFTGELTSA
ncbi:MAG: hypothetical protein ABW067_15645 [Rhizobacter sp.]